MPRALITGGAGFIGSHVVDRLVASGYTVDVIDDLSKGKRDNLPPGVTLHVIDVRSPEAAALVRDMPYDLIAHLAAQTDVRKSVLDPRYDADVNVAGSINLMEAVRTKTPTHPCRFVFVSTGGALYGEVDGAPAPESMSANPDSPYGIAKLGAELYAAYYGRVHGMDTTTLRLGNVYGPRQDPLGEAGVVAIFCGRVRRLEPLVVFGDGNQIRDYVYVGDVADAVLTVSRATLPAPGPLDARAFNIGTGIGTSVLELARMIGRVGGIDKPDVKFAEERRGELRRSILSADKAAAVLGWTPRMSLEEGLKATYDAL